MGRQAKVKKPENLGKGKVTPIQVAFLVDRYLVDQNFTQTSSSFRTEASSLISKDQFRGAPNTVLSLGEILDDYISLKEQKVMVDQEKCRVETLLQGMKNVMQAYCSGGNTSPPLMSPDLASQSIGAMIPRSNPSAEFPSAGYPMVMNMDINSTMNAAPWHSSATEPAKFSTPTTNVTTRYKRKGSKFVSDVPTTTKRACRQISTKRSPDAGTNTISPSQARNLPTAQGPVQQDHHLPRVPSQQGSSVAKSLFKQSPPGTESDSPGPKTPPQALNTESDLSVSPLENSSHVDPTHNSSSQEITPTSCPGTCPETVTVSPSKRVAYYSIERNHYISTSSPIKTPSKRLVKRDHVKGRLDFDASNMPMQSENPMTADNSTPGSSGEADIFDMDIPNFDIFGADFCLSELLVDIDFACEGTEPTSHHSSDLITGTSHERVDAISDPNQTLTEVSTSVSEVLCEKSMNIEGSDSLATVKSITKRITVVSPAKKREHPSLDQENLSSRD